MISTAALALAFTAGLVATVNPCGFAMLPVYLGFFLGSDEAGSGDRVARLARAISVAIVVSLGFVAVFGAAGLLLNLGIQAEAFATVVPWLAIAIGAGVMILGIAMLRGFTFYVRVPGVRAAKRERTMQSMFLFGITYAIASLSCTLPVFLSLVTANFAQQSVLAGTLTFIVYGLGMATVLTVLSIAMAMGRDSIVTRMRASARHLNRVSGMVLLVAGIFIVWYWATILGQGAGAAGEQRLVRWVDEASSFLTNIVINNRRPFIAATVGIVGGTALYVIGARALRPPIHPAAREQIAGRER